MAYRWLADATVALHLVFILFVIFGGLLVWHRVRWAYLHLPAVAWVVWLEFTGAICPLTPLENALRRRAGDAGYAGGFVEHYLLPVLYPAGLTPQIQSWIGLGLLGLNVAIYWVALARWRARRRRQARGA